MTMAPVIRKITLTAHVAFSVGSIGAVASFLVLALAALNGRAPETIRAAYVAMDLTARVAIVPLIVASLVTGLVQSLATNWGLFRHYWVLVKLVVTSVVLAILLMQMELIGTMAAISTEAMLANREMQQAGISLAVHALGGLLVLLVPVTLSVFKPRGLTRYGWRKQQEEHGSGT
jgi:hypothetical protein